MHDGEPLVHETLRIWQQIGRSSGAQAISLSVMEFTPGISPTIQNDACDQILYLLDNASGDEVSTTRGSGWVFV